MGKPKFEDFGLPESIDPTGLLANRAYSKAKNAYITNKDKIREAAVAFANNNPKPFTTLKEYETLRDTFIAGAEWAKENLL